jgi:hypothetical protein
MCVHANIDHFQEATRKKKEHRCHGSFGITTLNTRMGGMNQESTRIAKRSAVSQEIKGTTTHSGSMGVERTGAKAETTRTRIATNAREACIA